MKHLSTLFLLLILSTTTHAQSPQVIAQKLYHATMILEMTDNNGRTSHGTAFVIGEGLVATNAHVIDNAQTGIARLVQKPQPILIEGFIAMDTDTDLAVLKVSNTNAPALTLGDSDTIRRGDVIYTLGNPHGLEGTFSEGRVSNILHERPGLRGKVIQFTAPISRGSSGGAVVNQKGEVIAIVAQTQDDGQNLNFAVPVNALKRLMENATHLTPISQQKTQTPKTKQKNNLINFIILAASAFGVLHVLPLATSEKIWITIALALGIALFKSVAITMIPSFFTEAMLHLYQQPLSDNTIDHILTCNACLPSLVMKIAMLQAYLISLSILLALANRYIPKITIDGFFNTTAVAVLIIAAQIIIYQVIPIG